MAKIAVACSLGLADASYFISSPALNELKPRHDETAAIRGGALASVFIAPGAIFVVNQLLWPMPFGLLIAGWLLYFHVRNISQHYRELAGGVIVSAILWFMWLGGIREVQAYTHVIVARFKLI